MFIELHFDNKPNVLSVAHITRVEPAEVGAIVHVGADNPRLPVTESYDEVCDLLRQAGAKLAQKSRPMKISGEAIQKAKSAPREQPEKPLPPLYPV